MAHLIMRKIKNIECEDCGNILKRELIKYAMHNWKYCPCCGSNDLKRIYEKPK